MNAKLSQNSSGPQTLRGMAASPGIAIGPVLVIKRHTFRAGWYHLPPEQLNNEVERFLDALQMAEGELLHLRTEFKQELADSLSIIDSHIMMLKDQMLREQTISIIEEHGVNAEWALAQSLSAIKGRFEHIDDPYIKTRFNDVRHLADRIFGLLAGREQEPLTREHERVIIVAHDFSPEDTLRMRSGNIQGFLTESGGLASHTAIIARSLGIPAVVGLGHITGALATGDMIILDGHNGSVHVRPSLDQIRQYDEYERQHQLFSDELSYYVHLVSETFDGHHVRLSANIEMVEELDAVLRYGAEGIGLFRSEFDYLGAGALPGEDALFSTYRELVQTMSPHPATVRTLDLGMDKISTRLANAGLQPRAEANPALGMRSIRLSLYQPELFKVQLRALLRASVSGRLRIMLPFLTSLSELRRTRELISAVKKELDERGQAYRDDVEIGAMVEVPGLVIMADVLAAEVDFFSIGTNDLIQYSLAVDRSNQFVAHMFEPLHPAVLRMIHHSVECAHAHGIPVSVCGEMAGDVRCAPVLLGLGVDELSMRPSALPHVKRILRRSCTGQLRELGESILRCADIGEVEDFLDQYLPTYYPEEFEQR